MRYGVICQTPKKSTYITLCKEDYFNKDKILLRTGYKKMFINKFLKNKKKVKKSETDSNQNNKNIKMKLI